MFASADADYKTAAYYNLEIIESGDNTAQIFYDTIIYLVVSGDVTSARALAERAEEKKLSSTALALVLALDKIQKKDHRNLIDILKRYESDIPFIAIKLLRGWSFVESGMMPEAIEEFQSVRGSKLEVTIATFYKSMAFAIKGDFSSAANFLTPEVLDILSGFQNKASILASAQILALDGQIAMAREILRQNINDEDLYGSLRFFLDTLNAKKPLKFDAYDNVQALMAESMSMIGELSKTGNHSLISQIFYKQLALEINPNSDYFHFRLGTLHAELQNDKLAELLFSRIKKDSLLYFQSRLSLARLYSSIGSSADCIKILEQLEEDGYQHFTAFELLGDAFRSTGSYDLAEKAYSKAITASEDTPTRNLWATYFLRGITREQSGQWQNAVDDLNAALRLKPEHPDILNYLGYMMIEEKESLGIALNMIELALKKRPESGFIADSLAWGLYRLGRFKEALVPIQKAVKFEPNDPIINDHFGDILWKVGRKREASYQWRRALSFEKNESLILRINQKLELGLDQVLSQEKHNDS